MKAKNIYLLIFCVLLTYYCYLCRPCSEFSDDECDNYAAHDENGFYKCWRKNLDGCTIMETYNLGCENAKESFDNLVIRDDGLCERLNTSLGKCVFSDGGCYLKTCEELTNECESLLYCGTYGDSCKINDCQGFQIEEHCTIKTLDTNHKLFCKWEDNKCINIPKCTDGINECSSLVTSGDDYICFSDGEKCVESNSCENVIVTETISEEELTSICSKFPHCSAGNNNDCINNCNQITSKDECNYSLKDDETLIKCKWVEEGPDNKKCQFDTEIKTCADATNLIDIRDEQCSILKVTSGKNYCRKGPDGCFEFTDCDDINVKVDSSICLELTKPEDDLQCIPNGENGCKRELVKCLDNSLYIYNNILCEKLSVSMEGYKCFSDGVKCVESNSCDSIKDTIYDTNSPDLKKICDLFEFCEPYEKGCKTKIIPTTITIESTEITIESSNITTIPSINQTTILTTKETTVPKTIITTTIKINEPTTIPLTNNEENTETTTNTKNFEKKTTQIAQSQTIGQTSSNTSEETLEKKTTTTNEKTTITITEIINSSDNKVITPLTESRVSQTIILTNTKDSNKVNDNTSETNFALNSGFIYNNLTNIINTDTINTIVSYPKNEEETLAILLCFNYLRLYESYFTFNIYFLPVINSIFSNNLIFPISVSYNSNIRLLLSKELEGNCNLIKIYTDSKYEFFCTVETETKNIKQIKANPKFNFTSQKNIKVIGETPIAKMYMNNLKLIDEKFDEFNNSFVYILDHCILKQKSKYLFDISGSAQNPLDKLHKNDNLKIMINIQSTDISVIELDCNVANETGSNYTLSCKSNETFNADLQSAISFLDKNTILLINFDSNDYYNNNSLINTNIDSFSNRYFKKKENNKKVIYIVIISIVIALTIFIILIIVCIRQRKLNKEKSNVEIDSSFKGFGTKNL